MEIQNVQQSGVYPTQTGMKPASHSSDSASVSSSVPESSSASAVQKQSDKQADDTKKGDLKKELMQLTDNLNKEMNPLNVGVRFGFEDKIGEMSVSVFEKDTDKLIRKFPSDEAVALMTKIREIIGIIFDKKA
jgi:flagellar protein FlaG